VGLKLCTSHLYEKNQSVWGALTEGGPSTKGAPCHGTIGTMVNPALASAAYAVVVCPSVRAVPGAKHLTDQARWVGPPLVR